MDPFERSTPEECGISSRDILELLKAYTTGDMEEETHSFLLLRHGKLLASGVFSPFSLKEENTIFSCSKMFVGTAAGFAMAEGLFGLDDTVASLLPEYLPKSPDERALRIRVRHLLTMTVGQSAEVVHEGGNRPQGDDESTWAEEFFLRKCEREPGEAFGYDSFATYMLSFLIKKLSGVDFLEYLRPRLFEPLGLPTPPCIRDKNGIPIGWTGLRITLGMLARIGQLYLEDGKYKGKQILPPGFVALATQKHIDTDNATGPDWSSGYCFQFWRGQHDSYRFCGALGQMCVILPQYDMVFGVFSGFQNPKIHKELEKFYDILLSKVQNAPLPPDEEGNRMLEEYCRRMAIREEYATPSPLIPEFDGRTLPIVNATPFHSVRFSFAGEAVTLTLQGEEPITFAAGMTAPLRTRVFTRKTVILKSDFETDFSATARFLSPAKMEATARILASPTILRLEADFEKGEARLTTLRGSF